MLCYPVLLKSFSTATGLSPPDVWCQKILGLMKRHFSYCHIALKIATGCTPASAHPTSALTYSCTSLHLRRHSQYDKNTRTILWTNITNSITFSHEWSTRLFRWRRSVCWRWPRGRQLHRRHLLQALQLDNRMLEWTISTVTLLWHFGSSVQYFCRYDY